MKSKKKTDKKSDKKIRVKSDKKRRFEINLHSTMDASVWATAYKRRFGGKKSLLMGWFANAIMCGWDHASQSVYKDIPVEYRDMVMDLNCLRRLNQFLAENPCNAVTVQYGSCAYSAAGDPQSAVSWTGDTTQLAVENCHARWMEDKHDIFSETFPETEPEVINEFESTVAPGTTVRDRNLTVAAAYQINDFLGASWEHTVSLGECFCGFYDKRGENLICSVSAPTLSAAVEACHSNWTMSNDFDYFDQDGA